MVFCEVKPHKEDPNRMRITVTVSQICYPGDVGTPTGSLDFVKLIINSVLLRCNSRFFSFDLKTFTSKPQWKDPNICASRSRLSHKNSLSNTTLQKQTKMAGSILRSSAVVMAYRNQADLPITSWAPILRRRVITKTPQHLAYGAISVVPSNLFYSLTNLASNVWAKNTPSIS